LPNDIEFSMSGQDINVADNIPAGSALLVTTKGRAAPPKTVLIDDLFHAMSLLDALIY
jgi:hypothetical protein